MKKVCLIIGAGAGIGGNVALKFAKEGYFICLCRRTDKEGLDKIENKIKKHGGESKGFLFNAVKEETIEETVSLIEKEIGQIEVAIYNLGAQIGDKNLLDTTYKQFELGWRMGTFGLFRLASSAIPFMLNRNKGTLIVTSSTAAVRGNPGQHSHASAMGARRMLCQSLNAEFSLKGIHVVHVIVDGAVDAPDTLGKMLGQEKYEELKKLKGNGKDGLLLPEEIAKTYFFLSQQHRSSWTHEIDLRSFSDLPWWNHITSLEI